ncbi:MAG: hypothetical protein KAJ91_03515 [Candidatus Aenigmarchaeota archaeon]|nr:hypothetical protein [Candidatus Aenigmarchaeota archaeon]
MDKDNVGENKVFLVHIACGAVFILLGLVQVMRYEAIGFFASGYVLIGIMYILLAVKTSKLPKTETMPDERFIGIRDKAGFYAFFSIIAVVMILSFVDLLLLYDIIDIGSSALLFSGSENIFPLMARYMFISFVGVMVFIGVMAYYLKKGN